MKLFKDNGVQVSAMLIAGMVLTGCVAVGGGGSADKPASNKSQPTASGPAKSYMAEPGLTPRQRFTKALENLENGEQGQALAELNAYLKAVPRSNSAKNLVEQITTDSSQYFPADFFSVNLTSGTSLSTLAKKYLGSALKFYALAKYNNISNPSRVDIGQEIKIPLTQLAKTVRQNELTAPVDKTPAKAEEVVAEQEPTVESAEVETLAEPVVIETPAEPEVTASALISDLQVLNQTGDFAVAIEKLEALSAFGEFDKTTRDLALTTYLGRAKQLVGSDKVQASGLYSQAGQLELINGETFAAFQNFKLAHELDENNAQAMEDMLVLQKDIADKYHREASSAFRRQELDDAIAKWDKVLEVNPDHSSAKLYRAQAIELKQRLEKIKGN